MKTSLNFITALTLSALSVPLTVHAQFQTLFPRMIYPNIAATGPFDLNDALPLQWTRNSYESAMDHAICNDGEHDDHHLVGQIPLHIVYYGQGFTPTRQNLVENFFSHIGTSDYWRVIQKKKTSSGTAAGTPFLAGIHSVECGTDFPCDIKDSEFKSVVDHVLKTNKIKAPNAVYMFLGGDNVDYVFDKAQPQAIMGDCSICGIHDALVESSNVYPYMFVPLLKSESHACNLAQYLPNRRYPNNDYALDNLIPVALHELVETIVSPVPKMGEEEMADVCNGKYMNIAHDNANIVLHQDRYTVFPIWDVERKQCSLGDNVSPLPSLKAPQGYCSECNEYALLSGDFLSTDQTWVGYAHRLQLHKDGNLVLYDNAAINGTATWQTGASSNVKHVLALEMDGNLVYYNTHTHQHVWSSKSRGPSGKYCAKLEKDGNIHILDAQCAIVWKMNDDKRTSC